MSVSKETLACAKKYTDDSMAGAGAVAGVPCQIQSITAITGGNRVTFLWIDNNGDSHTSTMDVMNGAQGDPGEKGDTGLGIKSMAINAQAHLIITYDDDTTDDAGEVPNVQADWAEESSTADSFIKNKPTLGSAAAKDYTTNVRPGNHDLVESNAVFAAIDSALTSVYTPHGDLTCAELTADLLIAANVGNVYTMTDSGTTSVFFINGAGITISANDSVGIIRAGADSIMFNYMGNVLDLHAYQKKELTTPLTIGGTSQTEVEGALGGLNTAKQNQTLATPLTIGGTSQTSVEAALGALNTAKADKTDLDNEVVTRSILGAHNLIPLPAVDGTKTTGNVTFTQGADGSVNAKWSTTPSTVVFYYLVTWESQSPYLRLPAGTYKLSGGTQKCYIQVFANSISGATQIAGDTGNGAKFTLSEETLLHIRVSVDSSAGASGDVTIYPMLRYEADADATYRPYAPSNKEVLSHRENSILGAKNFLYHGGSYTTQGVEFVGSVGNVITVTRTSASSNHAYYNKGTFTLKPGTYIFSNGYNSLPSGIQATYLYNRTDGVYFINCNNGPKVFTLSEEKTLAFNIEVQSSQSPDGVKIYPMIRLVTDSDPTFRPHAMTNRELTEVLTDDVDILVQTSELAQYRVRKCGKVVECTISLQVNEAVTAWTDFATVPAGFRPSTYIQAVSNKTIYTGFAVLQIAPNGGIQSSVNLAIGDRVRFTAVWICP